MVTVKDFFKDYNAVLDDAGNVDASFMDGVRAYAELIVRCASLGVYVFDYVKKAVVYVSPNIAQWCNIKQSDIIANGCNSYLQYINAEDLQMLLEINEAVFSFLKDIPDEESIDYVVSYDFMYGKLMVNQHYSPLVVKDGSVILASCVVALSSSKTSGNIVMDSPRSKYTYDYSLQQKRWIKKEKIHLTDKEKDILRLSMQGLNSVQIADVFKTTETTVKTQKRNLYDKLHVHSIAEAIRLAVNSKLLFC